MRAILTSLVFLPLYAHALKSDTTQPIYVQADRVNYQRSAGLCTYIGHVTMKQGSSNLVADKVITYFDKKNNLQTLVAFGTPARYETLPEHKDTPLKTAANTITYHLDKQTVDFEGDVHIEQKEDTLNGPILIYKLSDESIISPVTPQKGQISFTIHPKKRV